MTNRPKPRSTDAIASSRLREAVVETGLGWWEKAGEAAAAIEARTSLRPKVGVVLGSGLGAFGDSLDDAVAIPYGEVPHWPHSSVVGHAGRLVVGCVGKTPVIVCQGRAHLYEGYSPEQIVFAPRVLHRLGVRALVVTNAAGAINSALAPGSLMLISDHLNLMGTNPLIGPNDERFGARFFDMSEAYSAAHRELAKKSAKKLGIELHEGIYAAMTGPSYETPAEIRMLAKIGADAVGMSTVPEVIAANHCGIEVLGISCLSNAAAGTTPNKLDHEEVLEAGHRIGQSLIDLLRAVVPQLV